MARGSGATTSVASTAALLEIAEGFSGSAHHKTLVFVSTDGSSIGALGAKRFISDYSDAALLDAAIVLSQPALENPTAPLVIPWSTGPQSTASQLAETANSTVSKELAMPAGDEGPLDDLFRLALPAGLGEQGPLIEAGLPAVRLSADGELPVESGRDVPESFDTDTFDRFGRAALSLILALDSSPGAVEHGPKGYIGVAGNLMPGWTIALLALSLLVPAALAAGSGLASAARSPIEAVRGFVWSLLRVVPFLGALLVILLATLWSACCPAPSSRSTPVSRRLGTGGAISVIAALLFYCVVSFFLRPLRPPPASAVATAAPAALLLACLATLGVWFVNPYLALLVSVGLQAWVLAAARLAPGRLAAAGLVLLGLVPAVVLLADLAGRFDAGFGVWHDLVLMVADGQIGVALSLLACLGAGAGVAIVALGRRRPRAAAARDEAGGRDRGAPARSEARADAGAGARARRGGRRRAPAGARSARAGEGPPPLVETARLDLPATRQPEGHSLALGDVADLGQPRAGIVDRLSGRSEVLARDGDQQLEVLAARRRQLDRSLCSARDLRHSVRHGHALEVDLDAAVARARQVAGVGAQAVADVDHRRRSGLGAARVPRAASGSGPAGVPVAPCRDRLDRRGAPRRPSALRQPPRRPARRSPRPGRVAWRRRASRSGRRPARSRQR